jgi:excisionase family DNA binding protein
MTHEQLLTKAEAAKRLAVSVQTITRFVKADRLKAVRLGKRRVGITQSSVDSIIHQTHQQKGI